MLARNQNRGVRIPFEGSDTLRRTDDVQRLTTRELCVKYENGTYPETDSMPTMSGPVGQMRFSAATLTQSGNMVLPGTLTVDGASLFESTVKIEGELTADGPARFTNSVDIIEGPTTVNGQTTIDGSAVVNATARFTNSVDITEGPTTIDGLTTIDGSAVVNATARFTNSVDITEGPTIIGGILTANGATRFTNSVKIDNGPTDITGDVTIKGPTDITGNLTATGNTGLTGDVTIKGPATNITSAVKIIGPTDITGDVTATGNTDLTGDVTVNGPTTLDGTLITTGKAMLDDELTVKGALTAKSSTQLEGAVDITNGPTTMNGDVRIARLGVNYAPTRSLSANVSTVNILGGATIHGNDDSAYLRLTSANGKTYIQSGSKDPNGNYAIHGSFAPIYFGSYAVGNLPRMVLDANGNLGIGTEFPKANMDVIGESRITQQNDQNSYIQLKQDSTSNISHIRAVGANSTLVLGTNSVDGVTISAAGVGIATTGSTTEKLEVGGKIKSDSIILTGRKATAGSSEFLSTDSTTGEVKLVDMRSMFSGGSNISITTSGKIDLNVDSTIDMNKNDITEARVITTDKLNIELGELTMKADPSDALIKFTNAAGQQVAGISSTSTGTTQISGTNIQLTTSATPRIYIDTIGNIGVGTTNPYSGLHINTGMILTTPFNNSSSRPPLVQVNPNIMPVQSYPKYEIGSYPNAGTGGDDGFLRLRVGGHTNSGTASYIDLTGFNGGSGGDMNTNIMFATAAMERMRITRSGNIGIGTSTPNYTLDVAGGFNVSTDQQIFPINNNGQYLYLQSILGTSKRIRMGGWGTTTSVPLTLNEDGGNVGVGTSIPGAKLDVAGNINIGTTSSNQNTIRFAGVYGDIGNYNHTAIGENIYENGTEKSELLLFKGNDTFGPSGPDRVRVLASGGFRVDTGGGFTWDIGQSPPTASYQNAFLVDGSGNVGINTGSPAYKLDVNGDMRVSGNIVLPSGYNILYSVQQI